MTQGERFYSIDVLKGIMVLFILFVNALYLPDILPVFSDTGINFPGYALSEWAVTGFIFMFGMTIPFCITKKINNGLSAYEISRGIFSKSIVLLTIGIMMVNTHRVNAGLTGFNSYTWSVILFCAIFLVWVRYPDEEDRFFTVTGLRLLGLALLVFLVFRFHSGTFENGGSLVTGWWEVPGLIGWGFLVSAFTYLAVRNSISGTIAVWTGFLLLNILTKMGISQFLNPVRPYIGPLTDGCFPFIMLSGLQASIILKKYSETEFPKTLKRLVFYGAASLIAGVVLKQTLLKSQMSFNPAESLIISGIIVLVFLVLHWIADIKKYGYLFGFLRPAGENYFTAYLFPYLLYNLLWLAGVPVFFFRQHTGTLVNMLLSFLIAALMMLLSSAVIKMNIKLKI